MVHGLPCGSVATLYHGGAPMPGPSHVSLALLCSSTVFSGTIIEMHGIWQRNAFHSSHPHLRCIKTKGLLMFSLSCDSLRKQSATKTFLSVSFCSWLTSSDQWLFENGYEDLLILTLSQLTWGDCVWGSQFRNVLCEGMCYRNYSPPWAITIT